jgi:hypothetical protein
VDEIALDDAYAALVDYRANFKVEAFHLYEHGDDGVWRSQREFRLEG